MIRLRRRRLATPHYELIAMLATQVLHWRIAPGRYLKDDRHWLPAWRFQPTKNIADAFQLLEGSDVVEYILRAERNGIYRVRVRTDAASAEASSSSLPLTMCVAIARLYGIRVEDPA
jgi:hypothetical protein